MIRIETFAALEESLTTHLWQSFWRESDELHASVEEALRKGDYAGAVELVNQIDLTKVAEQNKDYIGWVTNLAMLFGASRVTSRPGTSVVGLGHEKTMAAQAMDGFVQMLVNRGGLYLRTQALQLIALRRSLVTKAEPPVSYNPDQRVLLPFTSFMDKSGQAFFNMVSSLHTSRLSAYGFTAEASALGLEYYQINEQLDKRICPVCAQMHGKRFKVSDARQFLDVVLRVSDPEDLKSLQPWPSQSKDSVAELSKLTTEQMVARGWHIPPYHPRCRGLLVRVGKSPTLQQIEDLTVPEQGPYTATQDDFSALGYQATPEQVSVWNQASNVSPAEVAATMQGRPLDVYFGELLSAEDPGKVSGVSDIKFTPTKSKVSMQTDGPAFNSQGTVTTKVTLDAQQSRLSLDNLTVDAEELVAVRKKLLQSLYSLTQDLGFNQMSTKAVPSASYTFARGGFLPDYDGWAAMKSDISSSAWYAALPGSKKAMLQSILASDAPKSVFDLVDLGALGSNALGEVVWQAYLNVTDPDAMARFLTYFGG